MAAKLASLSAGRAPRIIVAGGMRGFIGKNLCRSLSRDGAAEVDIITTADRTLSGLTWYEASHEFNYTLTRPRPCDYLVNVSGAKIFKSFWHWQQKADVIDRRIETNEICRDLIVAAKRPPLAWINISSVGIYNSQEPNTAFSEESKLNAPDNWWAETCRKWEAAAALPAGHPTRHVTIRPGWVLGHDGGSMQFARKWFGRKMGSYFGSGTQPFPWIHIDDLVRVFEFALANTAVKGPLNAVAPQHLSQKEFAEALARRHGQGSTNGIAELVLRAVLHPDRAHILTHGQRVTPTRLTELGFTFKYPTLEAALDEIMSHPVPKEHVPTNPNYEFLHPSVRPQHPEAVHHGAHH